MSDTDLGPRIATSFTSFLARVACMDFESRTKDYQNVTHRAASTVASTLIEVGSTHFEADRRQDLGGGRPRQVPLLWVIGVLTLALALRIVPALDAVRPIVFEDEIGYLANAKFFSGVGNLPILGEMGYYQTGWGLALAPIYWLSSNPVSIYRFAIAISVLFGWAALWPIAGIVRRLTDLTEREALIVGALATLTPGSVLMSGYAYAETFLMLILACLLLVGLRFWARSTFLNSAFFGVLTAFSYVVHGRAIALPIVCLLFAILVTRRRDSSWVFLLTAVFSGSLVAIGAHLADTALQATVYNLPFDRLSLGWHLLFNQSPRSFGTVLVGQLWYGAVATGGMALIGLLIAGKHAWAELVNRRPGPWNWWLACYSATLFIIVITFSKNLPNPGRLDYYAYGRYLEVFSPPLVGLAIAHLAIIKSISRRHLIYIALAAGALTCLTVVAVGGWRFLEGKPLAALSVSGIAWAIDVDKQTFPVVVATASAIVMLLLVGAMHKRGWAICLIWILFCGAAVTVGEFRTMRVLDRPWAERITLQDLLETLAPSDLSYDTNNSSLYGRNGYQFALPTTRFNFFSSEDAMPDSDLVIARKEWSQGALSGARMVAGDMSLDEAVWVMPGTLQDDLGARGWLQGPEDTLPKSAKQFKVTLPRSFGTPANVDLSAATLARVEIEYTGTGALWAAMSSRGPDPRGSVRLLASWRCGDITTEHLSELPHTVLPGARVEVEMMLDPAWMGDSAQCNVTLNLLEEGAGPFSPQPAAAFRVARV